MNRKSSLLAFMLGMAAGSAVTWQIIKERYERRIEEDRRSLKAMYAEKKMVADVFEKPDEKGSEESSDPNPKQIAERAKDKPSLAEYARRLQGEGYTDYARKDRSTEEPSKAEYEEAPYVISPDAFGEMEDYETISLTYFADGVLTDEDDEPMDDIEAVIGDALEHFGEFGEEDSVFVRNDARKCDYEVLRDLREFSEVAGTRPPRF